MRSVTFRWSALFAAALAAVSAGAADRNHAGAGQPGRKVPGPAEGVVSHAAGVAPNPGLDGIYGRFAAAYASGDAGAAADVYTEDVSYLPPDSPVVSGREEARKGFERFFGSLRAAGRKAELSFAVLERGASGDLGFDVGVFTLSTSGGGAKPSSMKGKYVVVARRGADGAWRWQVDAYSGLTPPKAP